MLAPSSPNISVISQSASPKPAAVCPIFLEDCDSQRCPWEGSYSEATTHDDYCVFTHGNSFDFLHQLGTNIKKPPDSSVVET
jgi:hypothetical protein